MKQRPWLLYCGIAVAAVLLLYARTLSYSLYWDDFDDLRPWTWADLWSAFRGHYQPWVAGGYYFYRPLASLYFAAATALFGLDAARLHLIPLVTLTIAATLTGVFVARETRSVGAAALATAVYLSHPLTATAIGPWIANQYQGLLVIAALVALIEWRRQAEASGGLTWTLGLALVAAAWLKDDGIAVGPAILLMHLARARWTRDVPAPSRAMITGLITLAAVLVLWRACWLPEQLGYGVLAASQLAANLTRAWRYALLWHVGAAPLADAITLVKGAILIGAIGITFRRRPAAPLIVTGGALLAVMNLPLAFASSENRWHVVGLCAVLITTGALLHLPPRRRWLAAVIVVGAFSAGSWERTSAFAPCSADTLAHNQWALSLPDLPVELRAWIGSRDAACASGRYDAFTVPMRDMRWGTR